MDLGELRAVIKKLGGSSVVAEHLQSRGFKVSRSAVCKWYRIPIQYCPTIEELCKTVGVVRSDGNPYLCEHLCPGVEWHLLRVAPEIKISEF